MSGVRDNQNLVAQPRVAHLRWWCKYWKQPEHPEDMDTKDLRLFHSRTRVILVVMVIALIATLGLCLTLVLGGHDNEHQKDSHQHTPAKSPLYNEPSKSIEGHYKYAAVTTDSALCSKIGNIMMELKGGSAADAAIAAALCLGVMNPHSSGIGGGHFITYYKRASKEVHTVNGREQAPSGATVDMFTEAKETSSQTGGKSIGVPGEILGMYELSNLGGKLQWKELFKPAIKLCETGFHVGPALSRAMNKTKHFDEVPTFREFITNNATGEIYKDGDIMYRPRLARTLEIIAKEGPYAFYNGSLAENITLDIADAGGIITTDDLANYTALVKGAITFTLHDNMTVYSTPPPSGGPVYQFILNILNGYKMDNTSVSTVDEALKTYHRITEAFKHAFSLRSELGDCEVGTEAYKTFIRQLMMNIMDPSFGELTRALISDTKTFSSSYYTAKYANTWDKRTSHISVVAPNGDAVAITSTVNMLFGSKVIGKRTGIVFNDQMDDFATPGTANSHGLAANPANCIVPGKRPLSSMSPSVAVDGHGDVKLVVGSCGGPTIATSAALVTMETLWFKWGIKEAIDYPRIHHQLYPEELQIEKGFPQELIDGLRRMGHNVTVNPSAYSAVQGIQRNGSQLAANCDYRKYGKQDGY